MKENSKETPPPKNPKIQRKNSLTANGKLRIHPHHVCPYDNSDHFHRAVGFKPD
jgi:hypothetical protein